MVYREPEEPAPVCDNPGGWRESCDNPVVFSGEHADGTRWHLCQECADDVFEDDDYPIPRRAT